MDSDDKVTPLPVKKREGSANVLTVVHSYRCRHSRFEVDEKLAEVTCRDCGEKMSPMWVLIQIAYEERTLNDRLIALKTECQLLSGRVRTKCDHCGKMTRIRSNVTTAEAQKVAEKIRKESET
jgi:predicted RNA-binding Zn-ribbon protein involved in translation (DUF1610 family)